jgi:SWIM zinc finger
VSSGEDGGRPGRWEGGWWPTASRPRPVENGLKARSTRGAIAQTWWSGRFIAVLEDMGLGGRLERGRNYARRGQVISLDVAAGMASALVQGSRVQPYRVRVGLTAFGRPEWARLERALAASAWYSAKLLAGEMPEDIEDVFAEQGLTLFPASPREMSMYCSCPDWQVPCKHIAAVFYLLAEAFDDDPFAILAWRGRGREELLAGLHAARGGRGGRGGPDAAGAGGSRAGGPGGSGAAGPGGSGVAGERAPGAAGRGERAGVPLADCLGSFFALPAAMPVTRPPAATGASLLDQLPPLSLAVRGRALAELLRPAYDAFTSAPPP